MADDPAVRPPVRRILKIKLGKQLLATHTVRLSGLVSSASHDSKEAKSGSALHLARLRQATLQGYVPPSATADEIVARLRDGEGFAPGTELPPWDFKAPPVASYQERPAKRPRQLACADDRCQQSAPVPSTAVAAGATRREGFGLGPGRPELAHGGKGLLIKTDPAAERAEAAVGSGESNSDQATNSQAYLPLSPDDAGDGAARPTAAVGTAHPWASSAGQSSLATTAQLDAIQSQRPRPNPLAKSIAAAAASVLPASALPREQRAAGAAPRAALARAAGSCSPSPALAGRGDGPSTSGRQHPSSGPAKAPQATSGVAVETQTSHRDFPVLPLTFLELPRLCGTALSFQSIGPFDMQLEREQRNSLTEGRIETHIEEARRVKREGDTLFSKGPKLWTIKSLSKYVTASLMFMEAADAMLASRDHRREQRYNPRYVADLYRQTADLLVHTVTNADTIKGSGIGKEALRLLAERLCAICLLRHTSLMASNFKTCADRAQAALREHQRQHSAQGSGAGAAAGPSGSGQQPSPEDSSTSSLHAAQVSTAPGLGGSSAAAAHGGGGSQPLAGFGHEHVSELLSYARTTWRFAEFMKRSSKSFEAFLERPDVRQDQQAKLVCMHLAAVCMDVGMTPGMRVIHHAREAVRTMCEDLAR